MNSRLIVWLLAAVLSVVVCATYGQIVDEFDTATLLRVFLPAVIGVLGLGLVFLSPSVTSLKRLIFFIWLPALLLRMVLMPSAVSDDVNRYLWEGKLVAFGISPYAHTADAYELIELRDTYWAGMNHKDKPTAYPPLSEIAFGVISSVAYHPLSFKLFFLVADLLTLGAIIAILRQRGLSLTYAGFYAFNPIILISFAAEAHFDVLMLAPLVWAVWFYESGRVHWAVALASIASGIKWVTLPLIPFFAGRRLFSGAAVAVVTLVLPALVFWDTLPSLVSGLLEFGGTRSFNGPVYDLLLHGIGIPRFLCSVVSAVALLTVVCWRWFVRHGSSIDEQIRWILGALVILSPTVHFWYIAWLIPFVALRPSLPWLTFSITGGLYFYVWINDFWGLLWWQQFAFWLPFFLALLYEVWSTRGALLWPIQKEASDAKGVSVVIPTLNAEEELALALRSIERQSFPVREIVISDGGSTDRTRELGEESSLPVRVIHSGMGRGQQIAAGIDQAIGEWVVVLHADCVLAENSVQTLLAAAQNSPKLIGGAFGQRFAQSSIELLPIEILNDMRALLSRTAFGDQVQFFHRETALKHGLFPQQPLMEDVESSWRVRETGAFLFLGNPGVSSRKKWGRQGWWRRVSLVFRLVARYLWARRKGRAYAEQLTKDLYADYYGNSLPQNS